MLFMVSEIVHPADVLEVGLGQGVCLGESSHVDAAPRLQSEELEVLQWADEIHDFAELGLE
jgi:hypothetical protein